MEGSGTAKAPAYSWGCVPEITPMPGQVPLAPGAGNVPVLAGLGWWPGEHGTSLAKGKAGSFGEFLCWKYS